jgi:hypothetical protein
MEVEWVKVKIDETEPRSWPMDLVKIRRELPERKGASVLMLYPRRTEGQITFEDMKKLEDYGLRTKTDVRTGEDYLERMIKSSEEAKREFEERKKAEEFMKWVSS